MKDEEIKQIVIDKIRSLSVCNINSTETQYVTRCPYCGDSRNHGHGHFSIHIDRNTQVPMLFRCFKCDIAGIINSSVLEELSIYVDNDLDIQLRGYGRKVNKMYKLYDTFVPDYHVPISNNAYHCGMKIEYLNKRLGVNFDDSDIVSSKVILDIFDFMKMNKIESIDNVTYKQLSFLNKNYIGFLSNNNNCITFRNVTDKDYKRYYKLILDSKNVNPNTFYSIPNSFELMYTNKVDIHITEGIMDILSINKNVIKTNENNYYYAACGYGYISILKYLIYTGINTGINLHIYSDNDKTDYDHMKYLFKSKSSHISSWMDNIYIHRNTHPGEKDYGIPISRITDSMRKIK